MDDQKKNQNSQNWPSGLNWRCRTKAVCSFNVSLVWSDLRDGMMAASRGGFFCCAIAASEFAPLRGVEKGRRILLLVFARDLETPAGIDVNESLAGDPSGGVPDELAAAATAAFANAFPFGPCVVRL